tara:strand:- start:506 stop:904 length:399 start_codon:yes stop_codon:yes gene_type:complete
LGNPHTHKSNFILVPKSDARLCWLLVSLFFKKKHAIEVWCYLLFCLLFNYCLLVYQIFHFISLRLLIGENGGKIMITEKYEKILKDLELATEDAEKCAKGNASAGRRLRKAALEAMKALKELRAEIMEEIKK